MDVLESRESDRKLVEAYEAAIVSLLLRLDANYLRMGQGAVNNVHEYYYLQSIYDPKTGLFTFTAVYKTDSSLGLDVLTSPAWRKLA